MITKPTAATTQAIPKKATPAKRKVTASKPISAAAKVLPKKTTPINRKIASVKPSAAKPVSAKPVAVKPIVIKFETAKSGKKNKKSKIQKKASTKTEGKVKVVRDSFTMPKAEYEKIDTLKAICLKAGFHVKKSELLRAGLHALSSLSATQLKQAIGKLVTIKTGRPKNSAS